MQLDLKGSIITQVDTVIQAAIEFGVSDIHIEPYEKKLRVRYRLDGYLIEVTEIPIQQKEAIVSRIKVMASLDIAEKRRPQDGSMSSAVGLAFDDQGNIGLFYNWSGGLGIGVGATGGLEVSLYPYASHINDISGWGGQFAIYSGIGAGLSGEVNFAADINQDASGHYDIEEIRMGGSFSGTLPGVTSTVWGSGFTAEAGYTWMNELGNIGNGIGNIINEMRNFGIDAQSARIMLDQMMQYMNQALEERNEAWDFFNNDTIEEGSYSWNGTTWVKNN